MRGLVKQLQGSFLSQPAQKTRLEESKMRMYSSQIILVLAVIALLGTGSVFASSPTQAPESQTDLSDGLQHC
jgi:hypothetical protein